MHPLRQGHVNFFVQVAMQKGVVYVKLIKVSILCSNNGHE